MVEGAPLLREYTGNGIEGSNPFFSAIFVKATIKLPMPLAQQVDSSPSHIAK